MFLRRCGHRSRALSVAGVAVVERMETRLLMSAGQLDATFGNGGQVSGALFPGDSASSTALQTDGKIVIATHHFDLARFDPNSLLDPSFGVDGRVMAPAAYATATAGAMALQSDGKILVAGTANSPSSSAGGKVLVARYQSNGQLDATFGTGGWAAVPFAGIEQASSITIETGGRIVVSGTAQNAAGHGDFALAALTPTGALNTTFGTGGEVTTDFPGPDNSSASGAALQPDGRLIVVGYAFGGSFNSTLDMARYLPNGALDPAFGSGGKVSSGSVAAYAVALQRDGKIVIGGTMTPAIIPDVFGQEIAVARYNTNGTLDSSFGVAGAAATPLDNGGDGDVANSVLIQSNGSILAVGADGVYAGPGSYSVGHLVRFLPNGALDSSFGTGGSVICRNVVAQAAVLQPDGKIIAVGYDGNPNTPDIAVARFDSNGSLDAFGYHGVIDDANGLTGPITAEALQPDGKIVVAGSETGPTYTDAALMRYNADGTVDTTFGVGGRVLLKIGPNAAYNALLIQSNGDIIAGGLGTIQNGGQSDQVFALVRYLPNGAADHSFNGTGEVLTRFPVYGDATINALAFTPDNKVVAAGSAFDAFAIARYLPDGSLDPSFAYGGLVAGHPDGQPSQATSVAVQSDGKIIEAGQIGGHFGIIRLNTAGKFDTTFGTSGVATTAFSSGSNDSINSIALDPAGRIVAGGSTLQGNRMALARYTPAGRLDTTFGTAGLITTAAPTPNGPYYSSIGAIALQPDGAIITAGTAGLTDLYPGANAAVLARFTSQGLDSTFATGGFFEPAEQFSALDGLDAIALDAHGDIVAAGGLNVFRLTTV
ncbi:MAG TPA: hypothetical protein VFC78_18185 [Tepidisphaeraceae bacterium]|nr:hypothetical protein [Tepidisphaeraceae bacterium]